jgi:hypothetical protein
MISKQLLIFDFDGTIVTEDSVSKVFEVLPKEIQREGFSHYVQLFQNASKQVENCLIIISLNLTSENV